MTEHPAIGSVVRLGLGMVYAGSCSRAERTPDAFRFDVKAYSLLTGHPTRPQSLWADLREQLPAGTLEKRNVYAHHLSADALGEAWRRFGGGAAAAA